MKEYSNLTNYELLTEWNRLFLLNKQNPNPYFQFKMDKITKEELRRCKKC